MSGRRFGRPANNPMRDLLFLQCCGLVAVDKMFVVPDAVFDRSIENALDRLAPQGFDYKLASEAA